MAMATIARARASEMSLILILSHDINAVRGLGANFKAVCPLGIIGQDGINAKGWKVASHGWKSVHLCSRWLLVTLIGTAAMEPT